MRVDRFDYPLPPQLVAQEPPRDRDGARLMVLDKTSSSVAHRSVSELVDIFPEDALVVLNDTKVMPARLMGHKVRSGGKVEIFLVRREKRCDQHSEIWLALGRASKGLDPGAEIVVHSKPQSEDHLHIKVLGRHQENLLRVQLTSIRFGSLDEALSELGQVPLPPYIKRTPDLRDKNRYQTVFATHLGSVAAPTAGLHLSHSLLAKLRSKVELAFVTLHVGLGTFKPVTCADFSEHVMHKEWYEISEHTAKLVAQAKSSGRPIIAVGTTTVRALESAAIHSPAGQFCAQTGETDLLILPGFNFQMTNALLTNFHLPRSTLLALVCAFHGTDKVLEAYRSAVEHGYQFFSYGDAMFLSSR